MKKFVIILSFIALFTHVASPYPSIGEHRSNHPAPTQIQCVTIQDTHGIEHRFDPSDMKHILDIYIGDILKVGYEHNGAQIDIHLVKSPRLPIKKIKKDSHAHLH
jgi:hypothetical protein